MYKFMIITYFTMALTVSHSSARPVIYSHKGFHNLHQNHVWDCEEQNIRKNRNAPIEFTIDNIQAAFEMGADIVEFDTRITKDQEIIAILREDLDCLTNIKGYVYEYTYNELNEALDPAYKISFGEGEKFPLRGKYIGKLLTLEKIFENFPNKTLMINPKEKSAKEVELYKKVLEKYPNQKLHMWGSRRQFEELRKEHANLKVFINNHWQSEVCLRKYRYFGWLGVFPEECKNTQVTLEFSRLNFIWGWPHEFIKKFHENNSKVHFFLPFMERLDEVDKIMKTNVDGIIVSDILPFMDRYYPRQVPPKYKKLLEKIEI